MFPFSELIWKNFEKWEPPQSVLRPLVPLLRFAQGVVSKCFLHHKDRPSYVEREDPGKSNTQSLLQVLPLTHWATSRNLLISLSIAASSAKGVDWSIWVIIF